MRRLPYGQAELEKMRSIFDCDGCPKDSRRRRKLYVPY
jgi:hypothetical protein